MIYYPKRDGKKRKLSGRVPKQLKVDKRHPIFKRREMKPVPVTTDY